LATLLAWALTSFSSSVGGMGVDVYKNHFCGLGKFPESNGSQKGDS
jgi:hypothetical protein